MWGKALPGGGQGIILRMSQMRQGKAKLAWRPRPPLKREKVSKRFGVFLRATILREHLRTTASERLNPNEADRLYEKFSRRNTRGKLLVSMRCNL